MSLETRNKELVAQVNNLKAQLAQMNLASSSASVPLPAPASRQHQQQQQEKEKSEEEEEESEHSGDSEKENGDDDANFVDALEGNQEQQQRVQQQTPVAGVPMPTLHQEPIPSPSPSQSPSKPPRKSQSSESLPDNTKIALRLASTNQKVLQLIQSKQFLEAIEMFRSQWPGEKDESNPLSSLLKKQTILSLYSTLFSSLIEDGTFLKKFSLNAPRPPELSQLFSLVTQFFANKFLSSPQNQPIMADFYATRFQLMRAIRQRLTSRSFIPCVNLLETLVSSPRWDDTQLDHFLSRFGTAMSAANLSNSTPNLGNTSQLLEQIATFSMLVLVFNFISESSTKFTLRLLKKFESIRLKIENFEKTEFNTLKELSKIPPPTSSQTNRSATAAPTQNSGGLSRQQAESRTHPALNSILLPSVSLPDGGAALTAQAIDVINNVLPSPNRVQMKKSLYDEIVRVCQNIFGTGCRVHAFGSSASGFDFAKSDIDLCIESSHFNDSELLRKLRRELFRIKSDHLKVKIFLRHTRVPILKIADEIHQIECDICANSLLGVYNSRMLFVYSQFDPRLRPLVYVVKTWAKSRNISDASVGMLSSYAYVIMVIFYLQTRTPPILPCLQSAEVKDLDPSACSQPHFYSGFNVSYFTDFNNPAFDRIKNANKSSLGELIRGFFQCFGGGQFDYSKFTISIREGAPIAKQWSNVISIEDPFELRDLGGAVHSEKNALLILEEFSRAYRILNEGGTLAQVCSPKGGSHLSENESEPTRDDKCPFELHISKERAMQGIQQGTLFQGVLRVNRKVRYEAYVSTGVHPRDVLIEGGQDQNRALHGDVVVIQLYNPSRRNAANGDFDDTDRPLCGKVVFILEKRSPIYFACTSKDVEKLHSFVNLYPICNIYPKLVVSSKDLHPDIIEIIRSCNVLFIVKIGPWSHEFQFPKATICGQIGLKQDIWSLQQGLLLQSFPNLMRPLKSITEGEAMGYYLPFCSIPVPPSSQDPGPPINVPTDETKISRASVESLPNFVDIRGTRIFTIDPATARDLDDAVSIQPINANQFLVGVHIADVSRFVKEGDNFDLDARARGSSLYLPNSVEHMLDSSFSQERCSILPGEDRFVISVTFRVNAAGEIMSRATPPNPLDFQFHRTQIRSCAKLDYDTVQDIIDTGDVKAGRAPAVLNGHTLNDVKADIQLLHRITQNMRKIREQRGSLFIGGSEISFQLDSEGNPVGYRRAIHSTSHHMIEELMLTANYLAAIQISTAFGDNALLRRHLAPNDKLFMAVDKVRSTLGLDFGNQNETPSVMLAKLNNAVKDDPTLRMAIQHCICHELSPAEYIRAGDCTKKSSDVGLSGVSHFALALPLYTHFTSPIRRYADLIVHRMLLQTLGSQQQTLMIGDQLSQYCEFLNDLSTRARNFNNEIQRLYLNKMFSGQNDPKKLLKVPAVVISLGRRAFTVFIPRYDLELAANVKYFVSLPDLVSITSNTPGKGADEASPHFVAEETIDTKETTQIDSLSLSWNVESHQAERTVTLTFLKKVLVDLAVSRSSSMPELVVLNVWDFEPETTEEQQAEDRELALTAENGAMYS